MDLCPALFIVDTTVSRIIGIGLPLSRPQSVPGFGQAGEISPKDRQRIPNQAENPSRSVCRDAKRFPLSSNSVPR